MQLWFSHQALLADGWNYFLDNGYDGGNGSVRITYDYNSPAGIERFVATQQRENEKLFQNGAREIPGANLDFKRPLSLAEAAAFTKKYGLRASSYNLAIMHPLYPNSRASLEVGLSQEGRNLQGFDDSALNQTIATFSKNNVCDCKFIGVTTMRVSLDHQHYQQALADPDVYTVEMVAQVVKAKMENGPILERLLQSVYNVKFDDANQPIQLYLYKQLERFEMVATDNK